MKPFPKVEKIILSLVASIGLLALLQSWQLQLHLLGQIEFPRALIEVFTFVMVIQLLYRRKWVGHIFAVLYAVAGLIISVSALSKYTYLLSPGSSWSVYEAIQVATAFTIILISSYVLKLLFSRFRDFRTVIMIQKNTDTELIGEYVEAAKLWEKRLQTTDNLKVIEAGEQAFDKALTIFYEIKRRDPNLHILFPMLKHTNDAVRLLASRHLFGHVENEPRRVFEEISLKSGGLGTGAKAILKALKNGELEAA